jgi:hypothetical protein
MLPLRSHNCGSAFASLKNRHERRCGQHPLHAGPNSVVSKSGRVKFKTSNHQNPHPLLKTQRVRHPPFKMLRIESEGWLTRLC